MKAIYLVLMGAFRAIKWKTRRLKNKFKSYELLYILNYNMAFWELNFVLKFLDRLILAAHSISGVSMTIYWHGKRGKGDRFSIYNSQTITWDFFKIRGETLEQKFNESEQWYELWLLNIGVNSHDTTCIWNRDKNSKILI
jgi:hypothetical protein